mmetsp:Transcript_7344/g.17991  ORF Transcript_7344/g.17991 Transcript_7344/m.17991 type:complete len:452 (-) Transcript_7344:460-1815(-)
MSTPPTSTQLLLLEIIPRITGSLSILGSSYILIDVAWIQREIMRRNRRQRGQSHNGGHHVQQNNNNSTTGNNNNKRRMTVSDRFLLGMSGCDIIASVGTPVILNLALPQQFGGNGNQATCNAQGFSTQFVTATSLYTASLALSYLLTIKFKYKERQLYRLEWIIHFLILSFVVISGTTSVVLGLYNPTPSACTMVAYPRGCPETSPCLRGESATAWRLPSRTIPEYTALGFSVIAMVLIYWRVRHVEGKARKWTFQSTARRLARSSVTTNSSVAAGHSSMASRQHYTPQGILQSSRRESADGDDDHVDTKEDERTSKTVPTGIGGSFSGGLPPILEDGTAEDKTSNGNSGPLADGNSIVAPQEEPIAGSNNRTSSRISLPQSLLTRLPSQQNRNGNSRSSTMNTSSEPSLTASREVAIQGIFFILAFLLTWTVPTIARCLLRFRNEPLSVD